MDEKEKEQIDGMTHEQLAYLWRNAPTGHPLLQDETGQYFKKRLFEHFGGFTPELSKRIGW